MAFAGGLHVFPGGRVDPADADPRAFARSPVSPVDAAAALGGDLAPGAALAHYVAAIRELFEEAGVLLADPAPPVARRQEARSALLSGAVSLADVAEELDLRLRTDLLAPIGHWTTPPIMPRRFDTRFFAAELPDGSEPSFEVDEVIAHRWLTARTALEAMAAGEIGMWIPTSVTLQQLEHVSGITDIRGRIVPGRRAAPRIVPEQPWITRIVVSEAGGVPGQTVNAYLVGRRRLVLLDPGDPSDEAAEAYLGSAAAAGGQIVAIALTHVDPDHAAGAEGMALRLEVPILAGPGGGRPLPYAVREVVGGERIGAGDVGLEVIATPGPRPDHVAYVVDSDDGAPVVIVGDLVGPRADRAVLGPVDEAARIVSLGRLAARRHSRLFPGHGEPLGPEALARAPGVSGAATPPGSGGS
jgi:glyoxylase-like metal-dependent hydrolase (beta-lactamase superfamily II)/8-oxo-dGTP pyrophosphatase MutT (NUDIX family)